MDPEFWHQRWSTNRIGFHQQKVNSRLIKYWPQLELDNGARVFVPLCGKSHDLLWLARQGFQVMGVELSQLACRQFFTENNLDFKISRTGSFDTYQSENIELWCGDFFDLDATHLQGTSGVFDRAALVALPAEIRKRYACRLGEILPMDSKILLLTMEYDESKMNGPPFSVAEKEVVDLFSGDFETRAIAESHGPEFVGNLRERGLEDIREQVFIVRHNQATSSN